MQKIKLDITGIQYSQTQSGSYVLTLLEVGGRRKLPILIGGFEAQSIAVELEKMIPNRPLTHDLIKTFCKSFGVNVKEIVVYKFLEGVFYSKIICEKDYFETEYQEVKQIRMIETIGEILLSVYVVSFSSINQIVKKLGNLSGKLSFTRFIPFSRTRISRIGIYKLTNG